MKKLMICALLIASNVVFATDFYCPTSVTCTRNNDTSSCTINGDSSMFNQFQLSGPLDAGTYTFDGAGLSYDRSEPTSCGYWLNESEKVQREVRLLENSKILFGDYNAPNNNWHVNGNDVYCSDQSGGSDTAVCPFTDEPNSIKK